MALPSRWRLGLAILGCLLWSTAVWAQTALPAPPEPAPEVLPPITVTAPPPVAADVLRLVPGLIINQHQGGGKAEQYLIRGFDADHGTDLAIFVDGVPVNLRSHAHGQGYADLHFLIPETVRAVDVLKGRTSPTTSATRPREAIRSSTRQAAIAIGTSRCSSPLRT